MEAVVEFHAFYDNSNCFIVKELAIVSAHFRYNVVFKPPFPKECLNSKAARTARWLTRHFHHIDWDDGDIPYDKHVLVTLLSQFSVVYTNGLEKLKFLSTLHGNVKQACSSKDNVTVDCVFAKHKYSDRCALKSALNLWCTLRMQELVTHDHRSCEGVGLKTVKH